MGELHLSVLVQRLTREFSVKANVGKPQVVYRETVTQAAEEKGDFLREIAGKMQHGSVHLRLEPLPRGSGREFVSALAGEISFPGEFLEAVKTAFEDSCTSGFLGGYPVVDLRCTLLGVEIRDNVSSAVGFRVATVTTFQRSYDKAHPIYLEPVMSVDILVPEEYSSGVIGDIQARHGRIQEILAKRKIAEIRASIPLSRMFGYSTDLRSYSKGRGTFTMQFERFDEALDKK